MNDDTDVPKVATDTSPNRVYSGLRHRALSVTRIEAGIDEPPANAPVWGVSMETGYEGTTFTLFALADGSTSIYFSNGGGVIGGHAHESVRQANAQFLQETNQKLALFAPCDAFPIPATGRTIFYLLTDAGVRKAEASEDELGRGRHALSTLFYAAQDVITKLRFISEAGEDDS